MSEGMHRKAFWLAFVVVQSVGTILTLTLPGAHPAHLPVFLIAIAFPFAVACLFPGLLISSFLWSAAPLHSTDTHIVSTAIAFNLIVWYAVALVIRRVRQRAAGDA
jgi:Na+(H+)/acetate symporter ActP